MYQLIGVRGRKSIRTRSNTFSSVHLTQNYFVFTNIVNNEIPVKLFCEDMVDLWTSFFYPISTCLYIYERFTHVNETEIGDTTNPLLMRSVADLSGAPPP